MGEYKLLIGIILIIVGAYITTNGVVSNETLTTVAGIISTVFSALKVYLHTKDGDYK